MKRNAGSSTGLERAVNNAQGKLKNSFLNNYPHHIVPGYNLSIHPNVDNYDEDHLMELFEEFPYDSNLPRPLLPPARLPQCVLKNVDPALQLIKVKAEHDDNIKRITDYPEKHRRDLAVCNSRNLKCENEDEDTQKTSVPRFVAELAELIDSDPDPQFEGEYNWYYTGGSLNHLILSDQNILLFPYAEELVAVPIIEKPKSSWKPNFKNASKVKLKSTLFESRQSITSGRTCRIIGRQKHSCNLYSLSEDQGRLELDEIHEQSSDVPYVSADLSPIENNKYCVANGKRTVEIWDINHVNRLSSTSIPKAKRLSDNWMSIKFDKSDMNLVLIMDRCCLRCIDLRTPSDGVNLTLCPRNNLESCEGLSVNSQSDHNSFYQYLGSYHSLLLCDLRFATSCVVQKWTHLFKSPPLFCGIVERNNEEIITLSSQLSGETTIVLNSWTSDTQSHSYSLPRMPLTISETLRASQDIGKCLDPGMRTRLELCTAGTAVNLNSNYDVTLFTQNSIGDIFYQCITHDRKLGPDSDANKESLKALDAWEVACLGQRKTVKPLVVSEKANMKHVVNAMRNVSLVVEAKDPPGDNFPKWYQSVETMASYVDILAPELLAMWDMKADTTVTTTVTPHQKVLSWLDTETPSQDLTQSQTLIQSQDTSMANETNDEIYSQDLISVSQNIQNYCTPDNNATEPIVFDEPELDKSRKKVARKRKYVQGF